MTLNTNYNSIDFNTYTDEAESDQIALKYSLLFPLVDWLSYTPDQKEAYLLQTATGANSFKYQGYLNASVQSFKSGGMSFPRRGLIANNGLEFADNVIPDFIKEYQVVRAFELISSPDQVYTGGQAKTVKKQKIATLEQEFFEPNPTANTTQYETDLLSYQLIEPYLTFDSKSGSTSYIVRA